MNGFGDRSIKPFHIFIWALGWSISSPPPSLMIVLCNFGSELQAIIKNLIKSVVTMRCFTSKLAHFSIQHFKIALFQALEKSQEISNFFFLEFFPIRIGLKMQKFTY